MDLFPRFVYSTSRVFTPTTAPNVINTNTVFSPRISDAFIRSTNVVYAPSRVGPSIDFVNDRDRKLQDDVLRIITNALYINSTASAFFKLSDSNTYTPSSLTMTAVPTGYTVADATFKWDYYNSATAGVWADASDYIVGDASLTLTSEVFLAQCGTAASGVTYRCIINQPGKYTAMAYYTITNSIAGSGPPSVYLNKEVISLPVSSGGVIDYSNSSCSIQVIQNGAALTYNTAGGASTFNVSSTGNNVTAGALTGSSTTTCNIGNMTAASTTATPSVTYIITSTAYNGVTTSITKLQGVNLVTSGSVGDRNIYIESFTWSTTTPPVPTTANGAVTYSWTAGTYSPTTTTSGGAIWSSSVTTSPGGQYSLYKNTLLITGTGTSTSTSANWTNGRVINNSGPGAIRAFSISTSATPPTTATIVAGTGYVPPTSPGTWSLTAPTATLAVGEYMYQVDGIYIPGGNITWGNSYLSNLKVGSLEAISANLGSITMNTAGNLASSGKTYGSTASGVFLGASGGAYKFDVGNSTNYMRWSGTDLLLSGKIQIGVNPPTSVVDTSHAGVWLYNDGLNIRGTSPSTQYFQIDSSGNVYTPSFSVVAGVPTMASPTITGNVGGVGAIDTIALANNSATYFFSGQAPANSTNSFSISGTIPGAATSAYQMKVIAVASGGVGTQTYNVELWLNYNGSLSLIRTEYLTVDQQCTTLLHELTVYGGDIIIGQINLSGGAGVFRNAGMHGLISKR